MFFGQVFTVTIIAYEVKAVQILEEKLDHALYSA
jgi:hypothetical protein